MTIWGFVLVILSFFLGIYIGMWITVWAYLTGMLQNIEAEVKGHKQ